MHSKLLIYELYLNIVSIFWGTSNMNLSYLKTSLYTAITTAILVCSTQSQAEQYYKWVDKNGSTHYTTTPPPKGAKHLNKVSTYGTQPKTDKAVPEAANAMQEKTAPAVAAPSAAPAPAPSASAPR